MKVIIKKNYQDGFPGLISTAVIKFTEKQENMENMDEKCSFDLQSQVIAYHFGVAKARIQADCQLTSMVQSKEKMNPFLLPLSQLSPLLHCSGLSV